MRTLVSAVLAHGVLAEIPLFFGSARPTIGIHGNSNAVLSGIGGDGYFGSRGSPSFEYAQLQHASNSGSTPFAQ